MKKFALFAIVFLTGCFNDTSDLRAYVANIQDNTDSNIEPIAAVTIFDHFDYSAQTLRSPFDAPQAEAIQEKVQQMSGCLSPDPRRRKQPLEKYSLSNLIMRGTLGETGITWALVEASDKTLHRISVDSYVGLYNGRVTAVNQDSINVLELIPDGSGCWVERETIVTLTQKSIKG